MLEAHQCSVTMKEVPSWPEGSEAPDDVSWKTEIKKRELNTYSTPEIRLGALRKQR